MIELLILYVLTKREVTMYGINKEIESEFEYGADWESFKDYPHVEIKTKE